MAEGHFCENIFCGIGNFYSYSYVLDVHRKLQELMKFRNEHN